MLHFVLKNLQHDVVVDRVFALSRFQELFVKADGTALALDVLVQYGSTNGSSGAS